MKETLNLVYGLLWLDRPNDARRVMLEKALEGDKTRQAIGINMAQQHLGLDAGDLPRPIKQAVDALAEAESVVGLHLETDASCVLCARLRIAAMQLEEWASASSLSDGDKS